MREKCYCCPDGQGTTIADLVQTRRKAGSSSNILDQEAFHMMRYKAKYWTPDEQRLKAFKEVFGDDAIVRVRYFHFVKFFPWNSVLTHASVQDMFPSP